MSMTETALGKLHDNQTTEPRVAIPEASEIIVTPRDVRPEYYIDGHLRRVKPYYHTYNTWCKQRWRGRELLEIFADEFRDRPLDYYREAIVTGGIHLNGKITSTAHVVQNGDLISHTLHRHEPPVTANPIGIVHEDDDMIVINKPAGVPVHPTGRYNYNTVTEILRAERGSVGFNPLPCNRLDRLTSGVMFVAKHQQAALEMTKQISERTIKKEYVARVRGEFPATDSEVVCDRSILQISPKLGLNRIRARGKEARTVFKRLAYYPPTSPPTADFQSVDEGYSIVRCRPLTGRTHQLRVHLQFLGHPITNDPIYCNRRVFGPDLGRGDDLSDHDEDIMTRLSRMGKGEAADTIAYHHQQMQNEYDRRKAEKLSGELCEVCQTPLYSDPGLHELGIYLHARKYADQDGKWSYETALPEWALPPAGLATEEPDPLVSDVWKDS